MPLNPVKLSDAIHTLLLAQPIGLSPESSIITTPNPDGTSKTTVTSVMKPTFMQDPMAKVIADAVATAVVAHLITEGMVTGLCPPGTAGGPLIQGMIK